MTITAEPSVIIDRKPMSSKKHLSCFISVPHEVNVQMLADIVQSKNIEPLISSEVILRGAYVAEQTKEYIAQTDFVIAVLQTGISNANVYFDVGLAYALNKRVLVFVAPEISSLPWHPNDMIHIHTDIDNYEAMSFAIEQVAAAPPYPHPQRKTADALLPTQKRPQPKNVSWSSLHQLDAHDASLTEDNVVEILVQAIQANGLLYASKERSVHGDNQSTFGVDIALWVDELVPYFGNPFLIEVKKHLVQCSQIQDVARFVRKFLRQDYPNGVLVLYLEGDSALIQQHLTNTHPDIFALSIKDFLTRLEQQHFADIILALRSQKMHRGKVNGQTITG